MKQPLNFAWRYMPCYKQSYLSAFPNEAAKIDLPHSNLELPRAYFDEDSYQFISSYEKTFDLSEKIKNKTILLTFHGVMLKAKVYLNAAFLGEYVSGYLPFTIDISGIAKQEGNRLVVIVDSHEDNSIPPFGGVIDYLTFGGIYREVDIDIKPNIYVSRVLVNADEKGNLKINPILGGNRSLSYEISHKLLFKNQLIKEFATNELQINSPHLWNLETPHLYTLITTLKTSSGVDLIETKFGFRSLRFEKNGFYLNNQHIKLIGLNRHQSYPYVGYAMPKGGQEDDADILKQTLGVNIVRTSHYPQSEHFLNRCDEIGLLVISEIPGWQYIGKDETWRRHFLDFVERMIIKEYNHPSLIANGVRINESPDDHELYAAANKLARELDSNRPTLGVRNFKNSELLEDIYTYNDFSSEDLSHGLDNPKTIEAGKAPVLITEYLGHMYPTKANDDIERRITHALRHAKVIDDNYSYNNLVGAIGWCFADYYTHRDFGSGDHVCHHGVLDMFRNPKYAAYVYASQSDERFVFEILSNLAPGDFSEAIVGITHVATNADYIELYRNDTFVKAFYPNRSKYRYMKHPIIEVDDYIGASFSEAKFKTRDAERIKDALSYVALNGLNKLPFKHKFRIGLVMLKHHMSYDDLVELWNKYVATWGNKLTVFKFNAFKDGKLMASKMFGQSTEFTLVAKANKTTLLNEDTYDVARVEIALFDQYQTLCSYASLPLTFKTKGPIQVLGPSIVPLYGGRISVYVRSLKGQGKATLEILSDENKAKVDFEVK
ncbi:MAG: glycoside hydrolase family 2 protein [Methanomicrobia archaeon]|nr:glycoside hydrolase family 2 protein [Methanomicrobia archaeon]